MWDYSKRSNRATTSTEDTKELQTYIKELAEKCQRLPLAVEVLGNFMFNKITIREWQVVLESDIWTARLVKEDLLRSLFFSYYALTSNLKRCFTYCAFLPYGYQINKDILIKLWMAQGEEYFNNLVRSSFFQEVKKDEVVDKMITYKLHHRVHSLAQFLTENECRVMNLIRKDNLYCVKEDDITAGANINYCRIRHSTFIYNEENTILIPPSLYSAEKLRTLKLFKRRWEPIGIPIDLFSHFKRLRAFDLSSTLLDELPPEVENLTHLRYLNLSDTRLKKLPDTICSLCNLQTLILNDCAELRELPKGMENIIELRHLEIQNTPQLQSLPVGIGRLTALRTLSRFIVSALAKIGDLKELNLLQGHLEISGLMRIETDLEAKEAELEKKQQLRSLCLDFEHDNMIQLASEDVIEEVLEGLQPNPRLEKLEIRRYFDSNFCSWVMKMDSLLENLRIMAFKDCKKCTQLPPLGKLPSLEELIIENMDEVEGFGDEFYGISTGSNNNNNSGGGRGEGTFLKLKTLRIDGMAKLTKWDCSVQGDGLCMPRLTHLFLKRCPKLKVLPENISHCRLKRDITECPNLLATNMLFLMTMVHFYTKNNGETMPDNASNCMNSCFCKHVSFL